MAVKQEIVLRKNKLSKLYSASGRSKGLYWGGHDLYLSRLRRARTGYIILVDTLYLLGSDHLEDK